MITRLERIKALRTGPKIHPSLTEELVCEAVERTMLECENIGYCLACGAEHCDGIEPDARSYTCESCRAPAVYGAQEMLLAGYFAGEPMPAPELP
jgi:hypothetical protein